MTTDPAQMPETIYVAQGRFCTNPHVVKGRSRFPKTKYLRADLVAKPEWMEIESAPRDGTPIIVAREHGPSWFARFSDGKDGEGFYELESCETKINGATHWMEKPALQKGKGTT